MEAMTAEVPVIGFDVPGSNDLSEYDSIGLLFADEDSTVLAQVLQERTIEPESRSRLAASAKEIVREHYSAGRKAREYEELYWAMT